MVAAVVGDAQRIGRIASVVQQSGAALRQSPGGIAAPPNTVVLQFERFVARAQNCPDWSKSASYDGNNLPHSNLGCAIASNIQAAIDNPRDLERGRDPGPTNERIAADAIERLYRDQVKQPATQPTSTIGASGAAGGQNQQQGAGAGTGYQQSP